MRRSAAVRRVALSATGTALAAAAVLLTPVAAQAAPSGTDTPQSATSDEWLRSSESEWLRSSEDEWLRSSEDEWLRSSESEWLR
ncbi:hypothetical protein [Kineococcus glutinatus]|uniref:Uncharacterized protein n=1 Tax=Kineococcus glutinatus TaxID=1070872 RepID=A0ABP9HB38_9ACTN